MLMYTIKIAASSVTNAASIRDSIIQPFLDDVLNSGQTNVINLTDSCLVVTHHCYFNYCIIVISNV